MGDTLMAKSKTKHRPVSGTPFSQQVDQAAGELCIAIGEGKFREALCRILMACVSEAYTRGKQDGYDVGWDARAEEENE